MKTISFILALVSFTMFLLGTYNALTSPEVWTAADFLIAGIATGFVGTILAKI